MEYYDKVINKYQLAYYLYRVLNSSRAKLLASKYTLSSQKKVENKHGSLLPRLGATSSITRSLIINNDLARVVKGLDKASKKRLSAMLYLVEIKRFSSSKANGRGESALSSVG